MHPMAAIPGTGNPARLGVGRLEHAAASIIVVGKRLLICFRGVGNDREP